MATAETDLLLLKRFAESNDTAAFAEIVQRYAAMVFAACRRIVRDSALAEDVSQETFFRLMKRPESVSHSLGAWLHQAATNLAVDAVRSDSARRRREQVYAVESSAKREDASSGTIDTWAELSPLIDQVMAELPEEMRDLLVAHFLCGRPQNELAAEARTSAATMCRRIRAAVESLQAKMRERGIGVAPLMLMGLLNGNTLSAAPKTLLGQLGKMTLVSSVRHWFIPPAASGASKSSVLCTAAGIAGVSVVLGALCALFCTKTIPHPWNSSPNVVHVVTEPAAP